MPDINDLRTHLFDVLRGLKNGSIDISTAKAMNETAQVLINSAKVEVDFIEATQASVGSGFIALVDLTKTQASKPMLPNQTGSGIKIVKEVPGGSITSHRMR